MTSALGQLSHSGPVGEDLPISARISYLVRSFWLFEKKREKEGEETNLSYLWKICRWRFRDWWLMLIMKWYFMQITSVRYYVLSLSSWCTSLWAFNCLCIRTSLRLAARFAFVANLISAALSPTKLLVVNLHWPGPHSEHSDAHANHPCGLWIRHTHVQWTMNAILSEDNTLRFLAKLNK